MKVPPPMRPLPSRSRRGCAASLLALAAGVVAALVVAGSWLLS